MKLRLSERRGGGRLSILLLTGERVAAREGFMGWQSFSALVQGILEGFWTTTQRRRWAG